MKNRPSILLSIALVFCAWFAAFVFADEDKPIESYSASVERMGSARGPMPITIQIYSYTPDEDAAKLTELLKTSGQNAVADAIWKIRRGHIAPAGGVGIDVNYVRVLNSDKGKVIRLVTARQMSFLELTRNGISTDYPFGILDLTIPEKGKMEGNVIAAAKVQFNKDNALEVKSYGSDSVRLLNIRKDSK